MPSPFIHVGFALGYGTFLMFATNGSFTPIHCLVLAINGFFGPDIGGNTPCLILLRSRSALAL